MNEVASGASQQLADYAEALAGFVIHAGFHLQQESEGEWEFSGPQARAIVLTVLDCLTEKGWALTPSTNYPTDNTAGQGASS